MTLLPTYALIVAGGHGKRMGSTIPKQFIPIAGKPVLMHTILAFIQAVPSMKILLVLPPEQMQAWRQLCEKYEFNTVHQPTAGGKERFYSVRNGLELIPDNCLVGIHDGVRPIISKRLIINTFQAAEQTGNAIPAIPLAESARILEDDGALAIPRERIRIIQTPQVFHSTLIKEAYRQPYQEEFTDDATVFETAGHTVHMVEGDPRNIKITRPEDLAVAEVLLQQLLH